MSEINETVPKVSMDPIARFPSQSFHRVPTTKLTDHKIKKYLKQGRYGAVCAKCGQRMGMLHATHEDKKYHFRCSPKPKRKHDECD